MKFQTGDRLGPYSVRGLLGTGAMGEVYRAIDSRLDREVAIKVLSTMHADRDALDRFAVEARAVAALSHPNIITIHDIGDVDGLPYAVMEMLEGETLRDRLASGPLPVAEASLIATQIASALAAAHAKQIVHRDLKPANVFVQRHGHVKVLDFGVAKVLSSSSEHSTTMIGAETMIGQVIGTPGYMAPEQAQGHAIDARVDVFACGVVMYEMVTGARAFQGQTMINVLAATLDDRRPGFENAPHVPESLRRIIGRCLEKDPARRFVSGAELLASLERLNDPAAAADEARPAGSVSSIAVMPFTDMSQARDQEYLCEGMAEEIITSLSGIRGVKVASRTAAFQFRDRTVDLQRVAAALHVDCVLEGSVRTATNRLRVTARLTSVADGYLLWSKTFDKSLDDIFAVEDEIARAVVDQLRVTIAAQTEAPLIPPATPVTEAYTAYLKGRYYWNRRTEANVLLAIDSFTIAIEADPRYAKAYAGLADAYAMLAIYGLRRPQEVMPKAREIARHALELDPTLAEALVSLGLVEAAYDWAWPEAERHFLRALDLAPDHATALQWYAVNCLIPCGRFAEARRAVDRAVDLDPVSLPINACAGLVSYFNGQFSEAAAVFKRGIALDPTFGPAHFFLGQALAERGEHAEALHHAEQAVALSRRSAETLAGLGYAAALAGDVTRAAAMLDELRALAHTTYVSPSVIAQVHAGLGNVTEALAALQAGYDLRASDMGWLAVRPTFRRLRSEPAYVALVERVGVGHLRASDDSGRETR